jgi:hypothetical protein
MQWLHDRFPSSSIEAMHDILTALRGKLEEDVGEEPA